MTLKNGYTDMPKSATASPVAKTSGAGVKGRLVTQSSDTSSGTHYTPVDLTPPKGKVAKKWSHFVALGEPGFPRRHVDVCYVGSIGTGKTSSLVTWVLLRALNYPGIRIALVRDSLENLKRSTLQTLFERANGLISEDANPGDGAIARYVKREEKIYFNNGSTIWLFGIGDAGAVKRMVGTEWGAVAVDQLERIPQKAYDALLTRLRQKVYHRETGELVFPMAKATANLDEGRRSWVNRRYFEGSVPLGTGELAEDIRERKIVKVIAGQKVITYRAVIRARMGENESVNPYYLQAIAAAGDVGAAFASDEWNPSVEEVYPEWNGNYYDFGFNDLSNHSLIIGLDHGGNTSHTVAIFGLVERGGDVLYIDNEYIEVGRDARDYAMTMAELINDYVNLGVRRVAVYADPTIWNNTGHGMTIADIFADTLRGLVNRVPFTLQPAFRRGTVRVGPGMADAGKEMLREGRLYVHRTKAQNVAEMFSSITWGDVRRNVHPLGDIFDATRYLTMNMPQKRQSIDTEEEYSTKRQLMIPDWRY